MHHELFSNFHPHLLDISGIDTAVFNDLIIYGEIHGAVENAHLVYSLCVLRGIKHIAVEYGASVDTFIRQAAAGHVDFSLLDSDMFDSSILSIEMLKTIVELVKTGVVTTISYIDHTFDYTEDQFIGLARDYREQHIADNILALERTSPVLCILGNWHTRPRKVGNHTSALIRVRESVPDATLLYVTYGGGSIRNCGSILELQEDKSVPNDYSVIRKAESDFEVTVPRARPTLL